MVVVVVADSVIHFVISSCCTLPIILTVEYYLSIDLLIATKHKNATINHGETKAKHRERKNKKRRRRREERCGLDNMMMMMVCVYAYGTHIDTHANMKMIVIK